MNNIIIAGKILKFLESEYISLFNDLTIKEEVQISFPQLQPKKSCNYLNVSFWGVDNSEIIDLYEAEDYMLIEGYISNKSYLNSSKPYPAKAYHITSTVFHPLYIQADFFYDHHLF